MPEALLREFKVDLIKLSDPKVAYLICRPNTFQNLVCISYKKMSS